MEKSKAKWAERVLERNCWGHPSKTELVPIEEADESCKNPCGHIGIVSEDGWLYSFVSCAVCGYGLGTS